MSEEIKSILRQSALFNKADQKIINQLVSASSLQTLDKGEMLFMEGDEVDAMYVLASGRLRVFKTSLHGKEHVLHFVEQGENFAEAALFGFSGYPASAQANRKSTLLRIPKTLFLNALDQDNDFRNSVFTSMAIWLRRFADIIQSLTFKDVESRLASYLLAQCSPGQKDCADGTSFDLGVEKSMLASYLGTIPETLSRALRKMQDGGLISVNRSKITILNVRGLHDSISE